MLDIKTLLRQFMGGAAATRPQASLLLEARLANFVGNAPEASRMVGEPIAQDRQIQYRRKDGVAVMTIDGPMAPRGIVTDDRYRWHTYEGIQSRLRMIEADPEVHTLLADWNSPGGYVALCKETADAFARVAVSKRVVSLANPMIASAAYWIASPSDEICISPSGEVGSIGVLMSHQDWSAFFKMIGVDTTLISAGEHKTDGHPYGPLSDSVKGDFQAEVEGLRQMFTQAVGEYRPALGADGALKTEARMYFGADAVATGLADRVIDFDSLLAELSKPPTGSSRSQPTGDVMITQEQHDAAVVAARTEGHATGFKAANDRIGTILGSDQVKGKKKAALQIATAMPDATAEKVIEIVAALPKAESTASTRSIADRAGGQGALVALGPAADTPRNGTKKIDTKSIYANRAAQLTEQRLPK